MRIGFFGKLPSRGDFVRSRLSHDTVSAWDNWLQSVLLRTATSRDDGGAGLLTEGGAWRLSLPAGLCGPRPLAGVWLSSHDRVGRCFPLLIAAEAAAASESFLDAAERTGRAAIGGMLEPDALSLLLAGLEPPPPADDLALVGRWWQAGATAGFEAACMPDARIFGLMQGVP